ncbi:hypothetical protein [Roseovarius aestuarii]|uniref:Uncharacterized protein n=1 Tax=Roseovarius aestuarii TaxID=475083 RepID=A0A1X7BXJ7_9RHOB|nr:hypothetical protein [Roseovarius aestuarii]SMC14324.1 hypothetical protein ROA7745_04190 [Roseovarius aestuarii]
MDENKKYEGSLRAKVCKDGSEEYWCELVSHGIPHRKKLSSGLTLLEARSQATQLEREQINEEIARRQYFHVESSGISRGVSGDLAETKVGKFLIRELEIELDNLSSEQLSEFHLTILKMHSPQPYDISGKDLRASKKKIKQAQSALSKILNLMDELRYAPTENFLSASMPGVLETVFSLSQHLIEVERQIEVDLHLRSKAPKGDHAKKYFCELAIRAFLTWQRDWRDDQDIGITYPEDWRGSFKTTIVDGEPGSPMLVFVDRATEDFYPDILGWDFNAHHYAKQLKYLVDRPDSQLDLPVRKRE